MTTILAWAPAAPARRLGAPAPVAFIDSPVMNLFVDTALVTSATIIARVYGERGSKWSSFFWVMAALGGFRGLTNLASIVDKSKEA